MFAFCRKWCKKALLKEFQAGYSQALEEVNRKKHLIEKIDMEMRLGKFYIVVSNEWENPVVGQCIRYESTGPGESAFIPVIQEVISGEEYFCLGILIPFQFETLEALMAITPDVRYSLLAKTDFIHHYAHKTPLESFDSYKERILKSSLYLFH